MAIPRDVFELQAFRRSGPAKGGSRRKSNRTPRPDRSS